MTDWSEHLIVAQQALGKVMELMSSGQKKAAADCVLEAECECDCLRDALGCPRERDV